MAYNAFIAKYVGEKNLFLKFAPDFYRTFPHDHRIEIELPVRILAQNTFLNLLEKINQCKNRDILLVAHGNEKHGIYLGFGTKKFYKTYQVMFNILYYAKLMKLYSEIMSKKNPEEWLEIFRIMEDYDISDTGKAKNAIISLEVPVATTKFNEAKLSVDRYKRLPEKSDEEKAIKIKVCANIITVFRKYIKSVIKDIIFKLGIPRTTLNKYVQQIARVHDLKLNNLAFRGCNIGKDKDLLEIYRRFFNVIHINAPKVKINFGMAFINLRRNQKSLNIAMKHMVRKDLGKRINPEKWMGGSSASLYGPKERQKTSGIYYHPGDRNKKRDEFLITLKSVGNTPYYRAVAEHIDIAKEFAIRKFGPFAPARKNAFRKNKRAKLFEMPICSLETFPMTFPQDPQFINYLETVSGYTGAPIKILSFPAVKVGAMESE